MERWVNLQNRKGYVWLCEHRVLGLIVSHPARYCCPSRRELEEEAQCFLSMVSYRKKQPKSPGEEGYEFWRHYQ